jgi:hypothetical protein
MFESLTGTLANFFLIFCTSVLDEDKHINVQWAFPVRIQLYINKHIKYKSIRPLQVTPFYKITTWQFIHIKLFDQTKKYTVYTEWQMSISGVHPIMMEKSAQTIVRVGVHAHPLSAYYHLQSCSVRFCWEGRYTPSISSLPYMYSVPKTLEIYTTISLFYHPPPWILKTTLITPPPSPRLKREGKNPNQSGRAAANPQP